MQGNRTHSQIGVGLIEIMIALALGVIILLGVTEIASNNSLVRREIERSGRQIESAAYAIRLLESDLTNAAFWGERGAEGPGALSPMCPDDRAELALAMGYPLQGGSTGVGGVFNCPDVGNTIAPKDNTDYLAIRRANSCALGVTGCDEEETNFHIQVNSCYVSSSAIKPGYYLIGREGDPDITISDLVYTRRNCADEAPKYRFLNRIYYVNDAEQLVRAELEGTAYTETALVDGVELLRFEYGLDDDGDGQVDRFDFITDPNNSTWADVATVRVFLVVRNLEPSPGFIDDKTYKIAGTVYNVTTNQEFKRQLFTRTVSLRNVAGRREQ